MVRWTISSEEGAKPPGAAPGRNIGNPPRHLAVTPATAYLKPIVFDRSTAWP